METIHIQGGKPLRGTIEVSGMKNAALPILFATILAREESIIENVPDIVDIQTTLQILESVGAEITALDAHTIKINTEHVQSVAPPLELAKKLRGSYYLLGTMLARFGQATTFLPGGCDFGPRPIDQHEKAFQALGALVTTQGNQVTVSSNNGLHGAYIYFDCVTVGGTMNAMMAAVLAEGMTVIENAAREPHIVDLANYLNWCGAKISGAGTATIKIRGVAELHGCRYAIIPDMIEAGSYMVAAAATGGELTIENVIPKHLEAITNKLVEMGAEVEDLDDAVVVRAGKAIRPAIIKTLPYPGFPTDMNPQFAVLEALATEPGNGQIQETIYKNRFRYIEELKRMGANAEYENDTARFVGVPLLDGARVRAVDLRAGMAMVIAGLAASGETHIEDAFHIARGYDHVVEKLHAVGAMIFAEGR